MKNFKIHQLNKKQRFYILGTIIGITIVIIGISFVLQINKDLSEIRLQQKGTTYNRLLKDVLREIQIYRGLVSGNSYWSQLQEFEYQEKVIKKRLGTLNEFDQKVGNEIHTTDAFHGLVYDLGVVLKMNAEVQSDEIVEELTSIIEEINQLMVVVSDQTRLMLSSDVYAHYLVHHVVSDLPVLTEYFGHIRSIGQEVFTNNYITDKQKENLNFYVTHAIQSLQHITHGMDVIFNEAPSIKARIGEYSEKIAKDISIFIRFTEKTFLGEHVKEMEAEHFFEHATNHMDQIFLWYDMQSVELDNYMSSKLNKHKWLGYFFTLLMIVGILVSIYSFIRFIYSYLKVVEEVNTRLEKVELRKNKVEEKYKETESKLQRMERNLSQQILHAHEEERKRLSRELHDGIGQALYTILTLLRIIEQEKDEESKLQYTKQAKEITANAMQDVRQISRFLRPAALDDLGLIPAIQSLIDEYEKTHQLKVIFSYKGDKERFIPAMETDLYRISQESLTNAAKYAEASTIHFFIQNGKENLKLTITDDGKGFNASEKNWSGIGLLSMKERAEGLGGEFNITSVEEKGTTVTVVIPKKE